MREVSVMTQKDKETFLIALGGNALIQKGQAGTAEEQLENLRLPMRHLAGLDEKYKIVITHGNGPQVGKGPVLLWGRCRHR